MGSCSSSASSSNLYLLIKVYILLFLFLWVERCCASKEVTRIFNVMNFGALADGKSDNSKAFVKAWTEACKWRGVARIYVPQGKYMIGPTSFKGQCKGKIVFEIKGVLKAPTDLNKFADSEDSWIRFQYIDGLNIRGGGTFDGQGDSAWPYNKCSKEANCKTLPVSIRFDFVTNSIVNGITSLNSKNFHMNVFACKNLKFQSVKIIAPENSPNTDGIHIGSSSGITVYRSKIGTGDDCISIGPGSKDIYISKVTCGPGHGISVGSLGKYDNEDDVVGITVKNCTLNGTSNGLRIKTWAPSPPSIAKNFTFEGIYMNNVENPIIIDQEYCPVSSCRHESTSRVQITDVSFKDIWGISTSKLAVKFLCSRGAPCRNIKLEKIYLPYRGGRPSMSTCLNVDGNSYGKQVPPSCL